MNIFELKSQYDVIIKIKEYYFRRMSLGEWLSYIDNLNDTNAMGGILHSLLIGQETDIALDTLLSEQPGMIVSICQTIANQSDFGNQEKFYALYQKASRLSMTSIAAAIQHIMAAYPSYKLHEVLALNSDDFITAASFAETKLGYDGIIEFQLFKDLLEKKFREDNKIPDEQELDYSYEFHLKNAGVAYGSETTPEEETFVTASGNIKRGNRQEYLKRQAYEKEALRRRAKGLPPVSAAKYFAELDSEGVDPAGLEQRANAPANDVESAAAENAKVALHNKLARDKELSLKGVQKQNVFNWQNDAEPNL